MVERFQTIRRYDPNRKPNCGTCQVPMGRSYEPVPFKLPLEGHFNHSVGRYVSGDKDFKDALRQASDDASERTGIPHNFQPIDMRDTERLGVTGEGLEETARRRHDKGDTASVPKGVDI